MVKILAGEILNYTAEFNVDLYPEDNIFYSTNNVDWFPLSKGDKLFVPQNETVYLKNTDTLTVNYLYIKEVKNFSTEFVSSISENSSGVSEIYQEDSFIVVTYTNGNTSKIALTPETAQSETPDIDPLTIYTGKEAKVEMKNYKKGVVYLTDNDNVIVREDGVYIKALKTDTAFSDFTFNIYAMEPNMTTSVPATVLVKVVNLELAEENDFENKEFVGGRLLSAETIGKNDIIEMTNFVITK